jgi:hypothetical protein
VLAGIAVVAGALWALTRIDWRATLAARRPRLRHPVLRFR